MEASLEGLVSAQQALRSRFDDFQRALLRGDSPAYRLGIADFLQALCRWSEAQEAALLPALLRGGVAGRDPARELHLEWVQLRELSRMLDRLAADPAKRSDALGIAENLGRRLDAHEAGLVRIYFPAAAPRLGAGEWNVLRESAPD